jgi:hypothetical protein
MTGLKSYRSYVFKDKDPVIDILRTAVQDSGKSYTDINADSGVAASTMANWFGGAVKRPQFATVNAVARALGKEFVLSDIKRHKQHLKVVSK